MISPEHKKLLEQLPRSQFGVALKAFLNEKKDELLDVRNSKDWEDVLGKQKALKIVDDLFYFMLETKEVKKDKNQYQ